MSGVLSDSSTVAIYSNLSQQIESHADMKNPKRLKRETKITKGENGDLRKITKNTKRV